MNDTASAAPVRDYPPLPDFETVEQHIYGACRRYITQDIRALILQAIEDRGFRLVSSGGLFWLHGPSPPAQAGAAPLTDEQWQRIADLTDSILTRATKDEIERVIGIKGDKHGL